MPDSRLAQFLMLAQMIDEKPKVVNAVMNGMIVMRAGQHPEVRDAIHYVVWHPDLPPMPRLYADPQEAQNAIPWMELDYTIDEHGVVRVKWIFAATRIVALSGVLEPKLKLAVDNEKPPDEAVP